MDTKWKLNGVSRFALQVLMTSDIIDPKFVRESLSL